MQSYTNYIIGGLVVIAVGFLFYSLFMPSPQQNLANDGIIGNDAFEQDIATHTEDVSGEMNTIEQMAINTNSATSTKINSITTKSTIKKMETTYKVKMETNKGNIELELNTNIAPKTVENFLKLTNAGFYNGVKFHRVIKDFMIQTGDPQSKDDKLMNAWGTGGPGYKFDDEITDAATYKTGYKRGVLAMANSGANTNGSQFFIMHKDVPLPPNYTIFGKVISGIEVVDLIANVKTAGADRPVEAVVINKITVE